MTRDLHFRNRLIARALQLRQATQPPPAVTWTRDQLQQATARNHDAIAAALPALHGARDSAGGKQVIADREAEP